MRSIARDYGPLGVRANAVCPGWVTTPMADEEMQLLMDAHQISLEQAYQMVCRDVPLRRPASAEEIARVSAVSCVPAKLQSLPARRWWPTAAPPSSMCRPGFHFPVRSISMSSEAVFIQVGALAEGFAPHSNTLERQHGLAGTTLTLRFSDGATQRCRFTDEQTLEWGERRSVAYRATSIRPGVLFIDFLDPARANASITLVCDRNQGNFTAVYGQLPDEAQARLDAFSRVEQGLPLTAVEAEFRFGTLDDADVAPPGFTDELIGMRNMYTYSPTERYEHIYLNDNFYAGSVWTGWRKGWRTSIAATT